MERLGTTWLITRYIIQSNYLYKNIFVNKHSQIKPSIINLGGPHVLNRLRSPPRKTTVKRKEKLNGHMLKEHSMVFNHQNLHPVVFSKRRIATESSLRLLSRPRDELKLPGKTKLKIQLTIQFLVFQILVKLTVWLRIRHFFNNDQSNYGDVGFASFTHSRDTWSRWWS